MQDIKNYYRLCGVKPLDKQCDPMVNQITRRAVDIIFTKKQVDLYIKENSAYVDMLTIKENIIGGRRRKVVVTVV